MKIDPYLKRIQISDKPDNTLSFLEKLQFQHVTQIPFENLDILQRRPLSLAIPNLYDKIVLRKRGGVCFELNGLFHALLTLLGFDAHLIAGTVYRGDHWGIEDTHATILVAWGPNKYLVDVGFGGNSPRKPIPLTGEIIPDGEGEYRVRSYRNETNVFVLEKKESEDWNILYRFRDRKRKLTDFTSTCEQVQYSPDSPFNNQYFLMSVTEKGRKTLLGHSLTIVEKGEKVKKMIPPDQLEGVVQTFFN